MTAAVGHVFVVRTRRRPAAIPNVVGEVVVTASWWWAVCSCGWVGLDRVAWSAASEDAVTHKNRSGPAGEAAPDGGEPGAAPSASVAAASRVVPSPAGREDPGSPAQTPGGGT